MEMFTAQEQALLRNLAPEKRARARVEFRVMWSGPMGSSEQDGQPTGLLVQKSGVRSRDPHSSPDIEHVTAIYDSGVWDYLGPGRAADRLRREENARADRLGVEPRKVIRAFLKRVLVF